MSALLFIPYSITEIVVFSYRYAYNQIYELANAN